MLVSIQSHNHRAYIVIFSFLFTWPLRPRILNELRTKYVVRYWPLRSLNVTTFTFQSHVTSSVTYHLIPR